MYSHVRKKLILKGLPLSNNCLISPKSMDQPRKQPFPYPYAPCMEYLPTWLWFLGHILVNIPAPWFAYGLWNTQKCPIRNTSCTYKSQPFVIFWPEALRPSSAVRSPLFRMFVADRGIHLEEEDFRSIWWYWIHLSPNLRDLSWFTVIYQGRWWSPKYQGIWGYFMFKTMY